MGMLLAQTANASATLYFGYSMDAAPVSYSGTGINGFCGKVFHYLQSLPLQEMGYDLKEQPIPTIDQRFDQFAKNLDKQVGVECGADSATAARRATVLTKNGSYSGQFTNIFFTTQTKLLVKKQKIAELYAGQPLVIGIINPRYFDKSPLNDKAQNTQQLTTANISSFFPQVRLVPVLNRQDAINGLNQRTRLGDQLDGYASDAIILEDIRREIDKNTEQYRIEPPLSSFLREDYAITVYNDNAKLDLTNKINRWLSQAQGQDAIADLAAKREGNWLTQYLTDMMIWVNRSDHLMWLFYWTAFGVLIVGLLSYLLMALIRKKFRLMREMLTRHNTSIKTTIMTQNKESFRHYSRELHDNVCQSLVGLKREMEMALQQLDQQETQISQQSLYKALSIVDQVNQDVRQLSHDLRNEVEDPLDQLLTEFQQQHKINVERTSQVKWRTIPEPITTQLLSITREALQNIVKHAQASQVILELAYQKDSLHFLIHDNGKGFDKSTQPKALGIGLINIRERVKGLQGECDLQSAVGQGTTLTLHIPCELIG